MPKNAAMLILLVLLFAVCESSWSAIVIRSQSSVDIQLIGYDGLAESSLYKGTIAAKGNQKINTAYRGLALLQFAEGQGYPVLIGEESYTLDIADPAEPPVFAGSQANEFLYRLLTGKATEGQQDDFAQLMVQAKQLLESTYPIRTVGELTAKKEEMHTFVRNHYQSLRHSDMVRRLIGQYFMMHEYVDYHIEGAPATDIQERYQQAVVDGVASWLEILHPHIPEHTVMNYCLSLYYERSMVTLDSLITEKFNDVAYCPGVEKETWIFPDDLHVTGADGREDKELGTIKGEKMIAFVSDDCPVSMVATVIKARQMAEQDKGSQLIVAPLQQLSDTLLAMEKMVSNGSMLFINDEEWRQEYLANGIRLPLFVPLGDDLLLPGGTSKQKGVRAN